MATTKKYGITLDGEEYSVQVTETSINNYTVNLNNVNYPVTVREIDRELISNHITGIDVSEVEYTGEEIRPTVLTDGSVTEDVDYTVTYSDNIEVGTGKVLVTGIGDYSGGVTYTFDIIAAREDIADHITGIDPTEAVYTGEEIRPTVLDDGSVTLDEDYTVNYIDNIEEGTGTVIVAGIGEYTGSVDYTFTITDTREDISEHITGINPTEADYIAEEIKPTVVTDGNVTLDEDYTVEYTDNFYPGTGTVTITGIGNYKGTVSYTFDINDNRLDISTYITGISPTTAVYTGEEIKPTLTVNSSLVEDTDYTVEYSDNIEVGTATVTATATTDTRYCKGSVSYTFTITES